MGIDVTQLRELVVRPALKYIGQHSPAAENLVLGTALVESRGEYLKQVGGGPAIGLWQMEPATHKDIWDNYLLYNSDLAIRMQELATPAPIAKEADEMAGNLYYAAAMCRVHYLRAKEQLPEAHDARAMAEYWKLHYNTPHGAGTVEKALPFFAQVTSD